MTTALEINGTTRTQLAQFGELSVQGVVDRKRKIGEVMRAVMREGEHYGRIPGCGDKPTLYKAGAEILATTFALAPEFDIKQTDLPNGHREYQVICTLVHIPTQLRVGQGIGCCSTHESKYRWRRGDRKCPSCSKAGTIIKGKAEYGGGWLCFAKKGGCNAKFKDGDQAIEGQQTDRVENPDPADQYNTVLKMAKKRAQVDATLTATGASDILTQDLEDLPPASVNVDAIDVEYDEKPHPTIVAIDDAPTIEELEALAPQLQKLPQALKADARTRYRERKQALLREVQP